jgi:hypothetical protein
MAVLHDRQFGVKLCEILHLDPIKTRDIIITNKVNDIVRIDVVQYLQDGEAEELLTELKKYELHLIEE